MPPSESDDRRSSADKGDLQRELKQKLSFGSTLFSFYSIPAVSFLMHALAHIFNLCVCAMQIQFAIGVSFLCVMTVDESVAVAISTLLIPSPLLSN